MIEEELAALHARAMRIPYPWGKADFEELLQGEGVFLTVSPPLTGEDRVSQTADAKALCGFALGRVALDEVELLTLAVDPKHQGRGLGRATLAAFEADAKTRGAVRAFLEVAEPNAAARGLYASNGWQEMGRRRSYYRDGEARVDAILMCKPLSAA